MANAVKLLSQNMVREALRDPEFFRLMPEYAHLRAAPVAAPSQGCSGCAAARKEAPAMSRFVETTLVLAKSRSAALCGYFGGTPLMVSGTDPRTGRFVQTVFKP